MCRRCWLGMPGVVGALPKAAQGPRLAHEMASSYRKRTSCAFESGDEARYAITSSGAEELSLAVGAGRATEQEGSRGRIGGAFWSLCPEDQLSETQLYRESRERKLYFVARAGVEREVDGCSSLERVLPTLRQVLLYLEAFGAGDETCRLLKPFVLGRFRVSYLVLTVGPLGGRAWRMRGFSQVGRLFAAARTAGGDGPTSRSCPALESHLSPSALPS